MARDRGCFRSRTYKRHPTGSTSSSSGRLVKQSTTYKRFRPFEPRMLFFVLFFFFLQGMLPYRRKSGVSFHSVLPPFGTHFICSFIYTLTYSLGGSFSIVNEPVPVRSNFTFIAMLRCPIRSIRPTLWSENCNQWEDFCSHKKKVFLGASTNRRPCRLRSFSALDSI